MFRSKYFVLAFVFLLSSSLAYVRADEDFSNCPYAKFDQGIMICFLYGLLYMFADILKVDATTAHAPRFVCCRVLVRGLFTFAVIYLLDDILSIKLENSGCFTSIGRTT